MLIGNLQTSLRVFICFLTYLGPVPQLKPRVSMSKGSIIVAIVIVSVPISIVPLSSIVTKTMLGISTLLSYMYHSQHEWPLLSKEGLEPSQSKKHQPPPSIKPRAASRQPSYISS